VAGERWTVAARATDPAVNGAARSRGRSAVLG
jgi:hypothetical protein